MSLAFWARRNGKLASCEESKKAPGRKLQTPTRPAQGTTNHQRHRKCGRKKGRLAPCVAPRVIIAEGDDAVDMTAALQRQPIPSTTRPETPCNPQTGNVNVTQGIPFLGVCLHEVFLVTPQLLYIRYTSMQSLYERTGFGLLCTPSTRSAS